MIFISSYTSFPVVVQTSLEYPPADAPLSGTGLLNTTTVSGKAYGNGVYIASASSGIDTTTCPPSTEFNAWYLARSGAVGFSSSYYYALPLTDVVSN
jgi:hypothetical protein